MKIVSIWQPFASLAAYGFKKYETRGWPLPAHLIGQRIGIASTKTIKGEQRAIASTALFQHYYDETCLPELDDLPHGYLVATAIVSSCEKMTSPWITAVDRREFVFGDWKVGRYAWLLDDVQPLIEPIRVRGAQGLWDLDYEPSLEGREVPSRPTEHGRHLHDA